MYASSRVNDPLSAFLLFIEPLEETIIQMTNKYGSENHKDWELIDIPTLRAYLGLLILAGVYRSNNESLEELWDDSEGRPIFKATMQIRRFTRITESLRFDDKRTRPQRQARDKLSAIRDIFEKWVTQCKKCYNPGESVTVDEQMVPFRGRCPFRQYMKSKPDSYGIKIWVCCDSQSAYAWCSNVYVGRDRNCKAETKQGKRVVLEVTEGLEGRNVTCDNFFTSHELACELKKRKMTIVGTIRKNRVEIPPILLDMKKKPEFHSQFVFDHKLKATMISYVPKKGRFVSLLSTLRHYIQQKK